MRERGSYLTEAERQRRYHALRAILDAAGCAAAVVIGAFVWAAVKDGREDEALQARLGRRRRTRLGR